MEWESNMLYTAEIRCRDVDILASVSASRLSQAVGITILCALFRVIEPRKKLPKK